MNFKKYILLSAILFLLFPVVGQDLEKLATKDMLKISGGLNFTNIFYNASGIQNRRQPFTYFLSGNITGSILGINLPYTFNFSNNQLNYTQPTNIQSFNPTYKWAKGYIGITSMNFSPYTLSNHIFSGAGVELSPKAFKFSVLYGKFKREIGYDFENNTDINMSYKRMGWGGSAQYEKNGNGFKVTYFGAKDNPNSLSFLPPNSNVTPMENAAVSIGGKIMLYKKITVEAEYALSGLTKNTQSSPDLGPAPKNKMPVIFAPNATSQFFAAYKGSIAYRLKYFGFSFNYERIDPDYKTLGAYYFNNDFENFTFAPTASLLKGKLNISVNTGLQRNNLNNNKLNTTNRWVGSTNLSYIINKSWSLNGSFSNFSSYTRQRPQYDPFYKNTLDTLNFYQVSQSSMASVLYNFGRASVKQNLMLMANYQVTAQKQGAISDPGFFGGTNNITLPSTVINSNLAYNLMLTATKTTLTFAGNINKSELPEFHVIYVGPTLNFAQTIYKNLIKISAGSTYNQAITNNVRTSEVFNHRCSVTYSPRFSNEKIGRMNFSLMATYLQNLKTVPTGKSFEEFTGTFSLNYSF